MAASLRRTPVKARARDHLLVAYKAVLQAQFDDRGFRDGMQVPCFELMANKHSGFIG